MLPIILLPSRTELVLTLCVCWRRGSRSVQVRPLGRWASVWSALGCGKPWRLLRWPAASLAASRLSRRHFPTNLPKQATRRAPTAPTQPASPSPQHTHQNNKILGNMYIYRLHKQLTVTDEMTVIVHLALLLVSPAPANFLASEPCILSSLLM